MAFPWNRGDAAAQIPPAARRRRARARKNRQEETRRERSRVTIERRRQRLAILIGSSLILAIIGIVAFGYYQEFYKPPRVWAGNVRNVEFTMGDLVKRIRVIQGITGRADLTTLPFEYLQNMLNAEVLRQAAPGLGISVTKEDIDQAMRDQFYPPDPPAGQQVDPGQLEREFENNYSNFLTATHLSDQDFRTIVEEQLMAQQLRAILGAGIESVQEQVEVEWIRLDLDATRNIVPDEVKKRLDEGEDFATVAAEVGSPDAYANNEGYVGWVPRGAFPDLDAALLGSAPEEAAAPPEEGAGESGEAKEQEPPQSESEPLAVGAISNPIFTREGTYIVHKLSGPEHRELSDPMRSKLNTELVRQWYDRQLTRGTGEGWLRMNFNSEWYAWVADQVRLTAPRTAQRGG